MSEDTSEVCRICYEDGNLTTLCRCKGTVQKVHLECVLHWIDVSGRRKCELCGAIYNVDQPFEPYEKATDNQPDVRCREILLGFTLLYIFACLIYVSIHLF